MEMSLIAPILLKIDRQFRDGCRSPILCLLFLLLSIQMNTT